MLCLHLAALPRNLLPRFNLMLCPPLAAVPRNLLLRFKDDSIDESNSLATLLQVCSGSHHTLKHQIVACIGFAGFVFGLMCSRCGPSGITVVF